LLQILRKRTESSKPANIVTLLPTNGSREKNPKIDETLGF